MRWHLAISIALVASFGLSSFAEAQQGWTDEWKPHSMEKKIGGDVALWSAKDSGAQLPLVPGVIALPFSKL